MSAPVPEYSPVDITAPLNGGGILGPDALKSIASADVSSPAASMLAALKAPPAFPHNSGPRLGDIKDNNSIDLGGVVKNIVDFMETPLYMLQNTIDTHFTREDNGNADPNSIGSMLDDARQGIQKGWDIGINHNAGAGVTSYEDVIKHAQKGTPDEGNDTPANVVGFLSDLALDPLNAVPGTGIAKTVIKAPMVAAAALKDAGKGAASLIAKGADDVAAKTPEMLADLAPAEAAGKAAEGAVADDVKAGQSAAEGAVSAPPVAPVETLPGPAEARQAFNSIPAIANSLKAQDMGKAQAVFSALGQEFKTNVANSDIGNIIKEFKEGYAKPLQVNPETVLQAHLSGIANKENLTKEAAPTMAVPDKVKIPATAEEAPVTKELAPVVNKQEDIVNAAAANTVVRDKWANATPEARQETRIAEAHQRTQALNEPIKLNPQVADKDKAAAAGKLNSKGGSVPVTMGANTQQKIVTDAINDTRAYQTGRDLVGKGAAENKEGYIIPKGRKGGASAATEGGIRHPLLYDTHAQFRPFQQVLEGIKNEMDAKLAPSGRKVSSFDKPKVVSKLTKAVDSQLEASGMIPILNMSKYADPEKFPKLEGHIHLTQGDAIEAAIAKSAEGVDKASSITEKDIHRHLIGSSEKNAVNPMAFNTAVETLIRERSRIMEEIKERGAAMLPADLNRELAKSEQSIKDVLMGESKAYGPKATEEGDLKNIKETIDKAVELRGGDRASYEKEMGQLAHKILYDPHYGTMLEQRHLYNQAVHAADLEKFIKGNWQDLKTRLMSMAAGPWSEAQTMSWLNGIKRDTKNLLPYPDRAQYDDWIKDLQKSIITPAEEKAVHAVDPKATIVDSGKDAEKVLKDAAAKDPVGEAYSRIELYAGQVAADVMRSIHPVESFFNAKFPFLATSGFYGSVMQGKHSVAQMQSGTHEMLKQYLMKYPKAGQLAEDTKAIVRAAIDKVPVEGESARELKKVVGSILSTDTRYVRGIKDGLVDKSYLEGLFKAPKYAGVKDSIDSKWWANATKDNLHEFWQHIDFKDAEHTADIISKLHFAVMDMNSKLSMARLFQKEFGSEVAKEGYSKISWNTGRGVQSNLNRVGAAQRAAAERGSGFYDLLDKNLYYDKNAAWEIPSLHRFINESRMVSNDTRLGKFINNVFDPITQVMKATQTTLRPGHWVSNVMGDTIRNFLAGVYDPRSYSYNISILRAIGRDHGVLGDDLPSKLKRATMLGGGEYARNIPKSELQHRIPVRINGNVKYYTATEIGRMLEDRVFLSPHGVGGHEDYILPEERNITNSLTQAAVKGTDKLLSNKFYDLNKWSAVRDNLTRGALAVDTIIHGDHASIEDAINKAFTRVRKWAPTSADFSREEAMTARRTIMYYTWLRGMIPNIIETMVEKPGVFLAPNRALFSAAKANGVEPMSIGNPFPTNQLFPKYYYENIIGPQMKGPEGQLWGISPMAPSIDVLDTILKPNPLASVLGMANPFIKTPIELATQQSNGIPIKDNMQYLQDSLLPPQLSMISKATGTDLVGNGGFLQNRTDKGNSPEVPGTGIPANVFNFFTGLHATDFNDLPAIRSVEAEAKNAKSQVRSEAQRAAR